MLSSGASRFALVGPGLSSPRTVPYRGLGVPLWESAGAAPTLDLNFAENRTLLDSVTGQNLVTFTRASAGTYVGSDGLIKTAAENVPRFDHNPVTGECLGLLVEEQRTNEVRNSNNMSAVVTGSPGTLPSGWSAQGNTGGWTREIVGSGSIGALNYVDVRFSGTPTAGQFFVGFQSQGVVAASNGQAWAPSVYHQLVSGSLGNIIGYPASNLWSSTVSFLGSLALTGTIIPVATMQRYTNAATISNAGTAFISWGITFVCTIGNTYDFTIRFAGPQLEQGAFATSVIPTSGTAATRSADVASIAGSAFTSFYNQSEGTLFANARTTQSAQGHILAGVSTGSFASSAYLSKESNNVLVAAPDAAPSSLNIQLQSVSSNVGLRVALAFTAGTGSASAVMNGGAVGTDTSTGIPTTVDRLAIGIAPWNIGTSLWNGHIARLTYWPARLPNSTLQAITQ